MFKTTIRWANLASIFTLLSCAGTFGFLACVTQAKVWLIAMGIVWIAALVLLLRSGRP